jgi:ferrochelatase
MARSGIKSLDVVCPGFSADCLETIEEIDEQNREFFLHAGGERYRYIPALNDRPDHMRALADVALANLAGWVRPAGQGAAERDRAEAEASRQRAATLAAAPIPVDAGYGS